MDIRSRRHRTVVLATCVACLAALPPWTLAQGTDGELQLGFENPPDAAKPRTWWHWTGGNVTQEGITRDLEWMKRAGLGGFQLADVSFGSGQSVEPKVMFGTAEWLDAVRHAAAEADRLGLEMAIFSSPGWSETGGPWVRPEQAMKKLVWSETAVRGPRRFSGRLPQPPSNNGPIRNLAAGIPREGAPPDPTHYGDSLVVAYRTPPDEASASALHPKATTHGGPIDASTLLDDDLNTSLTIPSPEGGGPAWLQFEFPAAFRARAITLAGRAGIPVGRVLASDDGATYRTLVHLPGPQLYRGGRVRTFAFPEVSARFYRVELSGAPLTPATVMSEAPPLPAREYVLSEAALFSGGRVHRFEDKAAFSFLYQYESVPTPGLAPTAVVPRTEVVDLTSRMSKEGDLDWSVPAGQWTILRMGYSLTGAKNRPAVATGSGFEADKLSARHMEAYFHGYMDPIADAVGPLLGKSLRYWLIDSWEAGMQNWTEGILGEFRQRRGYDPTPYLPAMAGRVVESAEQSDRFLWDFRRTLADLFADNHYGVMAKMLHERGMGSYAEAAGVSLEIAEDSLLNKGKVDVPMGEFWMHPLHPESMYVVDVRGAASAAHAHGKTLVAAEAFTGGGYESPYALKTVADRWLAEGVNRIVFHTSAHQPLDTKPGNTMVGTHINRNITWAEQARPLMDDLTRSCFMLQQGLAVADLAYLLREGAPSTMPFWGAGLQPAPPAGYDYDYMNADVVIRRMSAAGDGRLVLPDGMSYRVLVLPEVDTMTLPLLRKIRELVAGGATVVGPPPTRTPGLTGYPDADREVRELASDLWGDLDGVSRTQRVYGRGKLVWGLPLAAVLDSMHIPVDFESSRPLDATTAWIHRRDGGTDIYFVANQTDRVLDLDARFRVSGREAELWHPDTGAIEPAAYAIGDGRVTVPLHLAERESVFVVFRRAAPGPSRALPRAEPAILATLGGPWDLSFPPALGAPPRITMDQLEPWTSNADAGVRYFSGTATYRKALEAPREWFRSNARVLLDLGTVRDLAEVSLNGRTLGTSWKPPFLVDVTSALKPSPNLLEIKVTNEWTNRLAGDRLLPEDERVLGAAASARTFGMPPGASPSGLLGPVRLVAVAPAATGQTDRAPATVVAGIPVNYDEALAGSYTLPELLTLSGGKPVRDADTWREKRRPEILRLLEENQFGRSPGRPGAMSFDPWDKGTPAFGGKAIRRQVTVYFSADKAGPKMDLLLYLPAASRKPVPLLLHLGFCGNSRTVDDPGVKEGEVWGRDKKRIPANQGMSFGNIDVVRFLEAGFGFATVYYADIDPDFSGGLPYGVRALYLKPGQVEPATDEWGAIAAWAWGLSRAMDYLETDQGVDAKRVAILGASRLGKTVLWAGARDPRFAMVIASCSGEGGAALSRRNYGETVAHLTAPSRYAYQFCAKYQKYAELVDQSPVDAHMLVALMAPRPLLLQTGDKDVWSDPKGEFLAAVAAGPVYHLLGKQGLNTDVIPPAGTPILHTIGYLMHPGGHGMIPSDWDSYLSFMRMHLQPRP